MVLGDTGQSPMACGIDQVLPVIRARFQGLAVSTRSPGRIALWSDGPWCRPAVPCLLGPGPMVRAIDELSRATQACVGGPAVSTSSPGRITLGSKGQGVDP